MTADKGKLGASAIILGIFLAGCISTPSLGRLSNLQYDEIHAPVGTKSLNEEHVTGILTAIRQRNAGIENDPGWIKKAYSSLLIKRLTNVSRKEYFSYRQYLDNGAVYILVHPSFFPFFHYPKKLINNTSDQILTENVIDKLLSKTPKDFRFAMLMAQERRTRDFLEFKSTDKKLVILIVPQQYDKYSGYTYRRGRDEYLRYLNEVTNESSSILLVESRSPNRGYLTEEDAIRLMELLVSIDAKTIYVGGGYVGRCLEDFYVLITEEYGNEGIYIVPELSDISPRELNNSLAKAILKMDWSIDAVTATNIMQQDVYRIQEIIPNMRNLK